MDIEKYVKDIVITPIWILVFVAILYLGFEFFLNIKQYTAAATWILAISTAALALITYSSRDRQYKKALIEKQLEEFYIPLIERLTYPTDSLNNRLDGDINKRMLQISGLKESINRIIRKKSYLSDIPLYDSASKSHYVFNGFIGGTVGGKVQFDKWYFDKDEDRIKWTKFLKQLYKNYEKLVRDYYHLSGRGIKIQAYNKDPEKVFVVKPEGGKDWL
ncbi:MAG: hypothetical protein QXS81_05290 [Candidatus Micrarchaeaceae archaeon]